METITFEDILAHYELKIREVSEELQSVDNNIRKAEAVIESGWSSDAAEACKQKLEMVRSDLTNTLADLSEALVKLSAIRGDIADEITTLV